MSASEDHTDSTGRLSESAKGQVSSEKDVEAQPEGARTSNSKETSSGLARFLTHQSVATDAPVAPPNSLYEIPDEFYDTFSPRRKMIIVAVMSLCSFLTPVASTSILSATPEVAEEFNTTGSIINVSNALYMVFMGLSPIVWGPLSQVYGRRWITVVTSICFIGCSIGTALAPNIGAFFAFRILSAFEGTSFLLVGSAVIGDIYRPTERATALGWFLSGTQIGPALGPFIGGVMVTYTTWRAIFWLQTALAGVCFVGAFFLVPETIYHKKVDDLGDLSRQAKFKAVAGMINPWRVLKLLAYPNIWLTGLASSALLWNMYSIFAGIRYVLNPRFNLQTPLQGGLFYLPAGVGYLVGTILGGRYADYTVKKYMAKRGERIAEDRLHSNLPFLFLIAACMLVYGWTLQEDRGGIPLAVVILFIQGAAQLFSFTSLNTYCLDVIPGRSGEVIAANYFMRYLVAAVSTAVVVPGVNSIGIGCFSTITTAFMLIGCLGVILTIKWGKIWRERMDERKAKRSDS